MNISTKLSVLAGICGLFSASAYAGGPATITLNGTVRDFASDPNQASANSVLYNNDFENAVANDEGIVALPGQLNPDGTPKYNTVALGADGTPIYVGGLGGTVTTFAGSAATPADQFYPWYHDDSAYNVDIPISITLTNDGSGLYSFSNPAFFPIDNAGFGNFDGRNFSFTDQFDTNFTYTGVGTFTFSGDDDVFVYINNFLVIDLGGVHSTETQTVDLTQLGLTTGGTYSLDIFSAERHTTGSDLALQTNLVLSTPPTTVPDNGGTGLLLAGAIGVMFFLGFRIAGPKLIPARVRTGA